MIFYEAAKNIVIDLGRTRGCETETIEIKYAVGRTCAQKVIAPIDIQPFDNSAMDGFALRRCDLGTHGGTLQRAGIIAAGDPCPNTPITAGTCVEIMTGAPTPLGADAVIAIEQVTVDGDRIHFTAPPDMGANIRRAGEDFAKGMQVLAVGDPIHPQHIMPLAALGIDMVTVYKKPSAAFLATGSELVDDLSQDLKSGQIYNSNHPYGLAALTAMGIETLNLPSMPDDVQKFQALLAQLMQENVDFIISSGAVSAGKFDFIREGLENSGAEILFHKLKIKPGKPNLCARLPNGTLYFGLPGNPVATAAGLRFLVQPCLRAMMAIPQEQPVQARAKTGFCKRAGLRIFLKARVESDATGMLSVDLLDRQASFQVSPFLTMNCWAIAPEDTTQIDKGDMVDIYPLYPQAGLI